MLTHWKTTTLGVLPLIAYLALYAAHTFLGFDIPGVTLPPLDQELPKLLALAGIGGFAADHDK